MAFPPAVFPPLQSALAAVMPLDRPADAVLKAFFREHPGLGQRDRGIVAETVYAYLRHRRSIEAAVEQPGPRARVLATLVGPRGHNLRELQPILRNAEAEQLGAVKARLAAITEPAIRQELPDWLWETLNTELGSAELAALAGAMLRPAPLDLRVNPLKMTRDQVLAQLTADGINATATPYSPLGIRLMDKPALNRHPLFLEGAVEVQDEGSQLLGYLVAPKRSDLVVDFCAGAGGKTLLLGALMNSRGRLYAFDVAEKRLANLKPRLARSGLSNVTPQRIDSERDTKIKRLAGKIDRVLVDAPCSGLGTLRRNPDLKWRQQPSDITELAAKQSAILASAATMLKPGGRLVYATCSVLNAENTQVVDAFLAKQPTFKRLDAGEVLRAAKIELPGLPANGDFVLLPHRHGCDGFYAAVLEKVAE